MLHQQPEKQEERKVSLQKTGQCKCESNSERHEMLISGLSSTLFAAEHNFEAPQSSSGNIQIAGQASKVTRKFLQAQFEAVETKLVH